MIKISDFLRSYFDIIVRKLMTLCIEKHFSFLLGCIECMRCSLFSPVFPASVCLSCRLQYPKMAEQIKMLFGVNTPGGPYPPTERGGDPVLYFGILLSPERRKLQTWNFACIQEGAGPNENYATVGHMRIGVWVM